jgi:hypothetical protein
VVQNLLFGDFVEVGIAGTVGGGSVAGVLTCVEAKSNPTIIYMSSRRLKVLCNVICGHF